MASLLGTPAASSPTLDKDWLKSAFLLSNANVSEMTEYWRTFSTAYIKYVDTSLGGNFAINQLPQFTRFADIRAKGLSIAGKEHKTTEGDPQVGLGRYYSEAIDDHSQLIHMRFGTARYNGLISFFTQFYDHEAGLLAREGRVPFAFYATKAIVTVVTLPYQVVVSLFNGIRNAWNFFKGRSRSKYYYLVPNPGMYWNRVNFIGNQIAVTMGLVPRTFSNTASDADPRNAVMDNEAETDDFRNFASTYYPGIFKDSGAVDFYAVSVRAKKRETSFRNQMNSIAMSAKSGADMRDQIVKFFREGKVQEVNDTGTTREYLEEYHNSFFGDIANGMADVIGDTLRANEATVRAGGAPAAEGGEAAVAEDGTPIQPAAATGVDPDVPVGSGAEPVVTTQTAASASAPVADKPDLYPQIVKDAEGKPSLLGGLIDSISSGAATMGAQVSGGAQFVTFRVDYAGTVQESFANTTKPSEIQGRVNGISSSARDVRFTLMNGQTGVPGIDQIISTVGSIISGGLSSVGFDSVLGLAGNALIDIPEHFDGSTTQFPTSSYTMELSAWSGNKFCQFQQLIVPIAMLLAGSLPLSTGLQSYTSPMLCELYSKGRNQIRLGMIDSLTITRGTGNVGWTVDNQPLGFDVSFSVKDLSTIMHAPIDVGYRPLSPYKGLFDEDNAFSDYMCVLGSASMADMIYPSRKLSIRLAQRNLNISSYFSWSRLSNDIGNNRVVGTIGRLFSDTSDRAYL